MSSIAGVRVGSHFAVPGKLGTAVAHVDGATRTITLETPPDFSIATGQGLFILQEIEAFKGLLAKDATLTENMERAQANMRR